MLEEILQYDLRQQRRGQCRSAGTARRVVRALSRGQANRLGDGERRFPSARMQTLLDWPKCDKLSQEDAATSSQEALPSVANMSVPEFRFPVNQNIMTKLSHVFPVCLLCIGSA